MRKMVENLDLTDKGLYAGLAVIVFLAAVVLAFQYTGGQEGKYEIVDCRNKSESCKRLR